MTELFKSNFAYKYKKYTFRKLFRKIYFHFKHRYIDVPSIFLNKNPYYKGCNIGDYTYGSRDESPLIFYSGENATLTIGRFCSFAFDTIIFVGSGNHRADWVSTYPFAAFFEQAAPFSGFRDVKNHVKIGNDVWVGQGAAIMSGVTIGNGAVIAAKSVVTKDVPAYAIVAGNPARLLRKRFTEEQIAKLEQIMWWDWPIEKVLSALPDILNPDIDHFIQTHHTKN